MFGGGRIECRGDAIYAYDVQGRLISKRTERKGFPPKKWQYQWDGEDQLRRVTTPDGGVWDYRYDPFGRRISKTCVQSGSKHNRQAQTVNYLWTGSLLSEERRLYADGREQTVGYHYEQGSFRPIAQEVDGELMHIVTDHLGTPKELLSEDGELRWSARHQLWGRIANTQQAANDANVTCLLRFQGQLEDEESGLYYNMFRYYDPDSGSYVSSDPIGLFGGITPYGYCSNPLFGIDPLGLFEPEDTGFSLYHMYKKTDFDSHGNLKPDAKPFYVGETNDFERRKGEHTGKRYDPNKHRMVEMKKDLTYGQARGYEQADIDKYGTKTGNFGGGEYQPGEGSRKQEYDTNRSDA